MQTLKSSTTKTFPFVLTVDYVGSGNVKEACQKAVEFSQHLQCMISVTINDVKLTVLGAIMSAEDVYKQWEYQATQLQVKN
jgi:hypothetical protein